MEGSSDYRKEACLKLLEMELADRFKNKDDLTAKRWEFLLASIPIMFGMIGLLLQAFEIKPVVGVIDQFLHLVAPIGSLFVIAVALFIGHVEEVVDLDKKFIEAAEKCLGFRALMGFPGFEESNKEERRYFRGIHFYLRMGLLMAGSVVCMLVSIQHAFSWMWLTLALVFGTSSIAIIILVIYVLEKPRKSEPEEGNRQPE